MAKARFSQLPRCSAKLRDIEEIVLIMTNTSFAISYTLKNEETILADAIRYHLALGAHTIYIHFYGTTDDSRAIAAQFPRIVMRETVRPDEIFNPPRWINEIARDWENNMDRRKRINVWHSAQLAHSAGIEWLFAIDADELPLGNGPNFSDGTAFAEMLRVVPSFVTQILMPNIEVVPERDNVKNPFRECSLFLNRFPVTEFTIRMAKAALRQIGRGSEDMLWLEYYFLKYRFSSLLHRLYVDPISRQSFPAGYCLGYSNHKSGIRTKHFRDWMHNIHRWHAPTAWVTSRESRKFGGVLHYDLYSANSLRMKYAQRIERLRHYDTVGRGRIAYLCMNLPRDAFDHFFCGKLRSLRRRAEEQTD